MEEWVEGYLEKERTLAVKGVFILLVFLSHFSGYVRGDDLWLRAYRWASGFMGQSVVVPFLLYSGFGVMESLRAKGEAYRRTMPRRRILGTLLRFDVAVLCFAALALALGHAFSWRQFALSLVAWDSLGNSNWYIFVILVCYAVAWAVGRHSVWWLCAGLSAAMIGLASCRPPWWSNTILAFAFGAVYSVYREPLERFLRRWYWPLFASLAAVYSALWFVECVPHLACLVGNCRALLFAILVVMATMKVRLDSPVLRWFGANLFAVYIYQRVPMIALSETMPQWFCGIRAFAALFVCLSTTVAIAALVRKAEGRLAPR